MNIIYAAGRRKSSGFQLERILPHLSAHNVKISAYGATGASQADWILDEVMIPHNSAKQIILADWDRFEPDLIISDVDSISSRYAQELGVRYWTLSPLNLLISGKEFKFSHYKYCLEAARNLYKFESAEKKLVYSPFGLFGAQLKPGFEWVVPYHQSSETGEAVLLNIPDNTRRRQLSVPIGSVVDGLLETDPTSLNYVDDLSKSSFIISSGETGFVSDALVNGKNIAIAPDLDDPESIVNAIMVQRMSLGVDLGMLEYMEQFIPEIVESAIFCDYLLPQPSGSFKYFHELLEE